MANEFKIGLPKYSDEIIKAHSEYEKAESKCEGLNEWDIKYKSTQYNAQYKWKIFSNICISEKLNPIEVAQDIQGLNSVKLQVKNNSKHNKP